MTHRFEQQAPRVEPEGREVRLRISRKDLRLVQHAPAKLCREFSDGGVDGVHRRTGPHHEGEVLEAGLVPRIPGRLGGWVEEVGTRLAGHRAVGELVVGIEENLEPDQRHHRAVVPPRGIQIGDIDADVSEHLATLTAGRGRPGGRPSASAMAHWSRTRPVTCGLGPATRPKRKTIAAMGELTLFLPLIIILGAFMFFASRRQKKAMQATIDLHNSLKIGDRVHTTSGLQGTIAGITDDNVQLEIAPGVVTAWMKLAMLDRLVDDTDEDE